MNVYMWVDIHRSIYIYFTSNVHMYLAHTHGHSLTHTHLHTHAYTHTQTHTRTYIYAYIYIYICMYIYIYTCLYIFFLVYKCMQKKLDGNYIRMLRAILNKSWRQHPTRHQLYGHLPPITKTFQVRRARHAGHCWRSRDELISDVLLWTPTHGHAKAGRPARTYIQQLCEDTGCCPEDLPRAMNDREELRERVRDIRATSAIW